MDTLGMTVTVTWKRTSLFAGSPRTFNNVTEVHYRYDDIPQRYANRVAFESDIHGTGCTYALSDIESFVVEPATEKAEEF